MQSTLLMLTLALVISTVPVFALNAGADLATAVRQDDVATVRALLDAGAVTNDMAGRFTPLAIAAIRGNAEIVKLLLSAGADPNGTSLNGANALSTAIRSCKADLEIATLLIDAGADIENRSGVGITPVMLAVQEQRTDMALYLLNAGADVNTLNTFGEGLLNYAIYTKNPVLIQALLDRGIETRQLRKLFTTADYDPPGYLDTPSHHQVICN